MRLTFAAREFGNNRTSSESEGRVRPSQATLRNVSTGNERVSTSDYGGGRSTHITHPYMGIRAWIRAIPEEGSSAIVQRRAETGDPDILYYDSSKAAEKIDQYHAGLNHYRQLRTGEIEINSSGYANVHWSQRGTLSMRGGITSGWLSHDQNEVGFKGATHRRLMHDYQHDAALVGEERFGLVWRKGTDHTKRSYIKLDESFAREYTRSLNFEGAPGLLFRHREGHVIDEKGVEVLSVGRTRLRRYSEWYTPGGQVSSWEIDEDGNQWWLSAQDAKLGTQVTIPKGSMRMDLGEKFRVYAGKNSEIAAENSTYSARQVLRIVGDVSVIIESTGAITLDAPNVTIKGRTVLDNPNPI